MRKMVGKSENKKEKEIEAERQDMNLKKIDGGYTKEYRNGHIHIPPIYADIETKNVYQKTPEGNLILIHEKED